MTEPKTQPPPDWTLFGRRIPDGFLALLLALAVLAVFWPMTHADFVYLDDTQYVQTNPYVQQGLSLNSIIWALTNPIMGNWHPLTMWSYMLDYEFFGLNPGGFHLTNLILHAADTALVFLVFYRLTGARGRSWLVAALFGLHPLHVESVAWVAERKDVLSALFWLLAIWTYARYADFADRQDARAKRFYALTLAFFVLGLMSKSMVVTLPCVFLLLDFWPLGRFPVSHFQFPILARLVREKIPFFALAAAASVLTFLLQKQNGAMTYVEYIAFPDRVGNAVVSYCRYLGKLFWPENLAIFYPHPQHWPFWPVTLAALFFGAVSLFVFLRRRQQPFLLAGWLWFVGTLVPVIGLVQVGGQAMADRYSYIPSLGFFILVVWGVHELIKSWRHQLFISLSLGTAALLFCGVKTAWQIPCWQNTETVSRHALAVTSGNYVAHDMLGCYFGEKRRDVEADSEFQAAIRIKPSFAEAHYNLGVAFAAQQHSAAAAGEFREVVQRRPNDAVGHYNLGLALFNSGQIPEAMVQYREAARLNPTMQAGFSQFCTQLDLNNLAWTLATNPDPAQRDGPRAVDIAEDVCAKAQGHVTIFLGTLAAAYAEAGRFDAAVATGQQACALAAANGDTALQKKNQELVRLYQSHRPYRDLPPAHE